MLKPASQQARTCQFSTIENWVKPDIMMSWVCPHKVFVLLSLLSFSLFVSTIALSVKSTTCRVEGNILSTDISKKTKTKEDHVINYRLSRDVRPLNYTLMLWPDLERKSFKGHVTIRIRVLRPTTNIEVHVKNLSINYVDFNDDANRCVQINTTNIIPKREVYEVQFGHNEITEGVYKLTLNFTGKLDTGIVGFYQSKLRGGV
ncbi:unnamed protein product [Pieris macdunnoughi]|uniref:Aminopeptidase N-like N-terminal domain-containing protein n=1 Tax=Pieris macdunnoughi TaxID=345717 RepID=A0A821RRP4_9NEOP|nr:unnamed protein product [Pieris macdunnoughi]